MEHKCTCGRSLPYEKADEIMAEKLQQKWGNYMENNIPSDAVLEMRKQHIIEMVEKNLPNFVEACKVKNPDGMIIMHQDAFAGDYQLDELVLLGAAVKYAGIIGGKIVHIIGNNRETIDK